MLQIIETINTAVNNFIWGVPAMVCIFGVGLYLSIRTNFLQIRKFPYAIKTTLGRIFRKRDAFPGSVYSTCSHGWYWQHCRCSRRYRDRRSRSHILDVGFCTVWHVYQIC